MRRQLFLWIAAISVLLALAPAIDAG